MRKLGNTVAVAAAFATGLCVTLPAQALDAVVTQPCNETAFSNALSAVDGGGGGTITFLCGTTNIPITSYKAIAHTVVIDGGGTIGLDGQNSSPLFQIYASAKVTFKRLTLMRGINGDVHAIENFGMLTLDQARVVSNVSDAAAVRNYGTLIVRASSFVGNQNNDTAEDGGAIHHEGEFLRIDRSTFNNNSAVGNGGAIYSGAPMTITNSTFNANSAFGGGAIFQQGLDHSRLSYVTVVGNSASYGAGIYNDNTAGSVLRIDRSLLAANNTGNCDGVLSSGGYNLSSDTHCGGAFTATGDLNNQTLAMDALANNGGPTQTMMPQASNPARNHIPLGQCSIPVDQRGAGRPSATGCDSGAVEVGGSFDLIFYDGLE